MLGGVSPPQKKNIQVVSLEFGEASHSLPIRRILAVFFRCKLAWLSLFMTDKSKQSYLLQLFGLPVISNLEDLSAVTHLSKKLLYRLSKFSDWHYACFDIPKKSGGKREIQCPSKEMKAVQAWILRNILEKIRVSKAATAFRPKTNIALNAEQHLGNQFLFCLDLEDFFPSITFAKVHTIFNTIGYNPFVSYMLASLCTYKKRLPQGGVTSPALSNLICLKLDNRLSKYVGGKNISYSRYADDICFSSLSDSRLSGIRSTVRKIIESEGFTINTKKTRFTGPSTRRKITGLVFSKDSFGVGRSKKRELRSKICNFIYACDKMASAERIEAAQHIHGWLSFLNSVDKVGYTQLIGFSKKVSAKAQMAKLVDPTQIPPVLSHLL